MPNIQQLVQQVAGLMLQKQAMLCCAESCTGGWISKACTDLAGSSAWFDCGFITYSNQAKQSMLNVPEVLLVEHGAVSKAVARAMALCALTKSSAQYALAVTGIAGPGGGSAEKPVGTVWFAWAHNKGATKTVCGHFSGNREAVRQATVACALQGLLDWIEEKNPN